MLNVVAVACAVLCASSASGALEGPCVSVGPRVTTAEGLRAEMRPMRRTALRSARPACVSAGKIRPIAAAGGAEVEAGRPSDVLASVAPTVVSADKVCPIAAAEGVSVEARKYSTRSRAIGVTRWDEIGGFAEQMSVIGMLVYRGKYEDSHGEDSGETWADLLKLVDSELK